MDFHRPHWWTYQLRENLPEWACLPTEEPLGAEKRHDLRMELQEAYNDVKRHLEFPKLMSCEWNHHVMELSGSLPKSISSELQTLYNKSTCFYWKQTNERDDAYLPSYVFGAIWKEWFRCHKGDPTIDYGHFFGRTIRITPTGPSTVTGIVSAHYAMCNQASSILDGLSSGEIKQERPYFLPDIQNYKLLPLLQAIIVIFEELIPDSAIPIGADGKISLDRFLQLQTVLLVQTGNESGLNSPISFQDLGPASALTSILPTKAKEVHNTTQIRVPLRSSLLSRDATDSAPISCKVIKSSGRSLHFTCNAPLWSRPSHEVHEPRDRLRFRA